MFASNSLFLLFLHLCCSVSRAVCRGREEEASLCVVHQFVHSCLAPVRIHGGRGSFCLVWFRSTALWFRAGTPRPLLALLCRVTALLPTYRRLEISWRRLRAAPAKSSCFATSGLLCMGDVERGGEGPRLKMKNFISRFGRGQLVWTGNSVATRAVVVGRPKGPRCVVHGQCHGCTALGALIFFHSPKIKRSQRKWSVGGRKQASLILTQCSPREQRKVSLNRFVTLGDEPEKFVSPPLRSTM